MSNNPTKPILNSKWEDQARFKLTHQVMEGNHYLNLSPINIEDFPLMPILITPDQWEDIKSRCEVFTEPESGIDRIMKPLEGWSHLEL